MVVVSRVVRIAPRERRIQPNASRNKPCHKSLQRKSASPAEKTLAELSETIMP
jgi:hypothetical protein